MQQSLLVRTLMLVDAEEMQNFGYFVRSPFFNSGKRKKQVEELYNYLCAFQDNYQTETLEKEKVCQYLFPDKPVIELQKVMSELYKVLEKYLAWLQAFGKGQQKWQIEVSALMLLNNRNKQDNSKLIKKLQTEIDEATISKDTAFYYQNYLLHDEILKSRKLFNAKTDDLNLNNTLQALDIYYLISRLSYACSMVVQSWFTLIDIEPLVQDMKNIMAVKVNTIDEVPILLDVLRDTFELLILDEQGDVVFTRLQSKILASAQTLPKELYIEVNAYLRNYCTRRYNQGEDQFLGLLFDLYKQQLKDGSLYQEGLLLPGTIQNIVNVGLKLDEKEWVLHFLAEHQHKIGGTEHPEEAYSFNLANYYFAIDAFQMAIDTLPLHYTDQQYEHAARRLEIKAYFELHSPLLASKMDAFKMFLHRERKRENISENVFEVGNNFLKFVQKLDSSNQYGHKQEWRKQLDKLNTMKAVAEREWLKSKMEKGR